MAETTFIGRVRGSTWYSGTLISGLDSSGRTFPESEIEAAYVDDYYLNLSTGEDAGRIYQCVKAGGPEEAQWAYHGNIKGPSPKLIDDLTSTSKTDALTANQGRYLAELIKGSLTYTYDIYPPTLQTSAVLKLTIENIDTTISITSTDGDIVKKTYEKSGDAELADVTFSLDQSQGFKTNGIVIASVNSSAASIRSFELLNGSAETIYKETIAIWNHVNKNDNDVWPSGTISESYGSGDSAGTASYRSGAISKVVDGQRHPLYPVTHAKAVWWNLHDKLSLYDYLVRRQNAFAAHEEDTDNPHKVTYTQAGAPPKLHVSATSEYGAASKTQYGHVRVGDGLGVTAGVISWDCKEPDTQSIKDTVRQVFN